MLGSQKLQFESEWVWNLIETVSKACSHRDQVHDEEHDPDMRLRLVLDCYTDQPIYKLGSPELLALHALAGTLEDEKFDRCCDLVDEVCREAFSRKHYGLTVATDILEAHKRDVADLTNAKAAVIQEVWKKMVVFEMKEAQIQPQDRIKRQRPPPARMSVEHNYNLRHHNAAMAGIAERISSLTLKK